MVRFRKIMAILLVLALSLSFNAGAITKNVYAKGKVKKITVPKSATVTVGKTKTIKVKIKTSGKISKKYTVKVSKKKIVKITKKSNAIKVKGLKAGTVKVTIKSKANKKKKKTITIKVVKADVSLNIKQVTNKVYRLQFSKKVSLTADKVTIDVKSQKSGSYLEQLKLQDLSTTDSKEFTAVVKDDDYAIANGRFIKFTIKGVNKKDIVKEIEAYAPRRDRFYEVVTKNYVNTNIYDVVGFYSITGTAFGKIKSVKGLPAGIKYRKSGENIVFEGTINKTGVYKCDMEVEDEKGNVYNFREVFLIGSDKEIVTYSSKVTVGFQDGSGAYVSGYSYIYVFGGSGIYNTFVTNDGGVYASDVEDEGEGNYTWGYTVNSAGNKKGSVSFVDDVNSSVKTVSTSEIEVKKAVKISGKVLSKSGKPITGALVFADTTQNSYIEANRVATSNENGIYEMYVIPGTYDIAASLNDTFSYAYDKKISGNTTMNITLNLYQLTIKSDNTNLDNNMFTQWYDKKTDEIIESGYIMFIKPGKYEIYSKDTIFPNMEYEANASFTLDKDLTVTAKVLMKHVEIPEIKKGTTTVTVGNKYKYYKFVPIISKTYTIESSSYTDPAILLLDADGNDIDYDDNSSGNEFSVSHYFTAGKTYYIALLDWMGNPATYDVIIK